MHYTPSEKSGNLTMIIGPSDTNRFFKCDRRNHRSLRFLCSESGAVTVDWVVLTTAVLSLGIAAAAQVGAGAQEVSADTKKCLRIQANLIKKDIPFKKKQKRAARRCRRL